MPFIAFAAPHQHDMFHAPIDMISAFHAVDLAKAAWGIRKSCAAAAGFIVVHINPATSLGMVAGAALIQLPPQQTLYIGILRLNPLPCAKRSAKHAAADREGVATVGCSRAVAEVWLIAEVIALEISVIGAFGKKPENRCWVA